MFISKISLPRRTFLRGVGTTVALPFLEAMVPALTAIAKTEANPQRRLGFVYVPNGVIMQQWTPVANGPDFEFTPILKSLEPFRDRLTVVSNLCRRCEDPSHAQASAGWLSSATAKGTEGQDFYIGTTIDQIVAKHIGQETPLPSVEVATEDFAGYVGGCSPGYACAYVNTLSWATPTMPLPMEINPRVVFERMFGRAGTSVQRASRMRANQSVLDSIKTELTRLEHGVGARDKVRVDEYLDNVREIERRIQRMEARGSAELSVEAPVGIPASFEEHVGLLFELLAVAYQADLTRVFTFMMAREFSTRTYPEIGVNEPHHAISHHQNKPAPMAMHAALNLYHVAQFAKFIKRLDTMPDGDGSLLDHSLIFYGAGMGNGNVHSPLNLPLVAVGGGVGKGHRHFQVPNDTHIGNLWVGVANQFGVPIASLGESTGRLDL